MLDRSEIIELTEQQLKEFIDSPRESTDAWLYALRISSGTSGHKPLMAVVPHVPIAYEKYKGAHGVMVCFGSRMVRLSFAVFARLCDKRGSRIMLLDIEDESSSLRTLIEDFNPDIVAGQSSFVARISNTMSHNSRKEIRSIILGAEQLTAIFETLVSEKFPRAHLDMYYSASEVGLIGWSCPYLKPNEYHPVDGVVFELADADEKGVGDLLVSKNISPSIRVDQYRIGDVGILTNTSCACGAKITYRSLGRLGRDYVKLAGALLRREEFDRVVALQPDLVEDYRVEASTTVSGSAVRGKIELHVYTRRNDTEGTLVAQIAELFNKNLFLTPTQTLGVLVKKRLFDPITIRLSSTPLPINNKGVKIFSQL